MALEATTFERLLRRPRSFERRSTRVEADLHRDLAALRAGGEDELPRIELQRVALRALARIAVHCTELDLLRARLEAVADELRLRDQPWPEEARPLREIRPRIDVDLGALPDLQRRRRL